MQSEFEAMSVVLDALNDAIANHKPGQPADIKMELSLVVGLYHYLDAMRDMLLASKIKEVE
jgi:hypothetical protein